MDIQFRFLEKERAEEFLPQLFWILYANMNEIAPSGDSYEEDFAVWKEAVLPALKKEPRKIILIYDEAAPLAVRTAAGGRRDEKLVGYFQYYVNDSVFMMEEIQLLKAYHGSGLFQELYAFLAGVVPADTEYAEAYALKRNLKSQAVLRHLGLPIVGENQKRDAWHFRGSCREMFRRIAPGVARAGADHGYHESTAAGG